MSNTLRRRSVGRLLVLAPLVASALLGCAALGSDPQPTPVPTPVTVEKPTYQVARGDVVLEASLTGSVVLTNPIALSFKEDGRLKSLAVQVGDTVKKDQVLAQLDVSDLTRSLTVAQFNLDQDEVKLANSQKITEFALKKAAIDLDMKQAALAKLKASGGSPYDLQIAQDAVDLARVEIDELKASVDEQAQRQVARDRTEVDQIKGDIEGRTARAPIDGVVTHVADKLVPSATFPAFPTAIQMGDPAQVEIAASFPPPSSDVPIGQPATVTVPRLRDTTFPATLRKPEGAASGNPADQAARFSFDNSVLKLKPGETVYLSVVLSKETNVIWLPPNGIRTFMGRTFVVLREGGVEKRVDVELGTRTNDRVVIRQGLTEGQVVIGP
jgi:multidrug efflux pump subunit AcrA (membrane-fusion protein)